MSALNFASAVTARQYYSIHGNFGEPDSDFQHIPATSRPTSVDLSSVINPDLATLTNLVSFLDNSIPVVWPVRASLTTNGQTAFDAIQAQVATAAYIAWNMANRLARRAQWKWLNADAHGAAASALSISADASGSGSGAPGTGVPEYAY